MAYVPVNIGTVANDHTGDPIRTAFGKINSGFSDVDVDVATKVTGPASVTDDLPVIFDGTTGKLVKSKTYAAFKTLLALVKGDVGLGNVDNTSDANKPVSTAQAAAIAALLNASDAEQFKGVIDCSANPNYPAAESGYTYRVSVAGKIGGASGVNVEINDRLQCIVDGTVAGNQATVGANWWITQGNIDGAVVGPASATDGTPMVADGSSGKLIKNITYAAFKTLLVLVKGDVGLGNVDNTSDATKNAASATLTNKTLTSPVINSPTGIVKGDVGLGSVDNTSDATKNSASATLTNKTFNVANNTFTAAPVPFTPTVSVTGSGALANISTTGCSYIQLGKLIIATYKIVADVGTASGGNVRVTIPTAGVSGGGGGGIGANISTGLQLIPNFNPGFPTFSDVSAVGGGLAFTGSAQTLSFVLIYFAA